MDTAKIETELRSFVRNAHSAMTVRVKRVQTGVEHLAIYFIDASFCNLYPQQRYHQPTPEIPPAHTEGQLSGSEWFELAPGESPEILRLPDDHLISSITPDVSLETADPPQGGTRRVHRNSRTVFGRFGYALSHNPGSNREVANPLVREV